MNLERGVDKDIEGINLGLDGGGIEYRRGHLRTPWLLSIIFSVTHLISR